MSSYLPTAQLCSTLKMRRCAGHICIQILIIHCATYIASIVLLTQLDGVQHFLSKRMRERMLVLMNT